MKFTASRLDNNINGICRFISLLVACVKLYNVRAFYNIDDTSHHARRLYMSGVWSGILIRDTHSINKKIIHHKIFWFYLEVES